VFACTAAAGAPNTVTNVFNVAMSAALCSNECAGWCRQEAAGASSLLTHKHTVTVIDNVTDTVITTLLPLLHCVQTNVQVGAGRKLLEHPVY
jgi:hypothetical protein